jgi:DNA repair protein RecN (Recombination protein N)
VAHLKNEKSALTEITIRGLGVIDSAEIEIGDGLTVITGETGAGKTMVLTALNLILGAKSDPDLIRAGEERLVVTGKFKLNGDLAKKSEEVGGLLEDGELLISRTVNNQGKSKVIFGGITTTATQVNEFGEELVEIHAQASSARLSKPAVQRELLDSFGGYQNVLQNYQVVFSKFSDNQKRISELRIQLKARDAEISKIETLANDFEALKPKIGELELLENEINKLSSVEELNSGISGVLAILHNEENSLLSSLNSGKKTLDALVGKDSELDILIERFADLSYELQETNSGLKRYLTKLEADPIRFDALQARKAALLAFIKKHGKGSERESAFKDLIEEAKSAELKLQDLRGGDQRLAELESENAKVFTELKSCANELSSARVKVAAKLGDDVTKELKLLAMLNAKLEVVVSSANAELVSSYSTTGIDEILFTFTSHKDGKLLPLNKTASGGELSRVMLAIEVVLAQSSPIGTYIFDEVDAGVGGKAAVEVGRRLALLSQNAQVLVVTHLAQVASWANSHVVVMKNESGSVTQSNIAKVEGEDRKREIARLLSGQEESATAQQHAGELLDLVAAARLEMIG